MQPDSYEVFQDPIKTKKTNELMAQKAVDKTENIELSIVGARSFLGCEDAMNDV